MLWLYLHFPQLQLDALCLDQEDTTEQAIIIVDPQSHDICQLNDNARAKHLKLGMGLATASSLCQPLKIIPYQVQFEQQRLIELANSFYHLTADIALFEPKGMVFAVSSMLALHQGLEAYLNKITTLLEVLEVTAIPALAYSPVAAKVLAQSGNPQLDDNPVLVQRQLEQLPIEQLELPFTQRQQLRRIGMDCLSDIRSLPRKELGVRLGVNVLEYFDQLYGQSPISLDFFKPEEVFSETLILNHESSSSTALLFPLKLLLGKLQGFLRTRARLVQTLFLHFGYRDNTEQVIEIVSAEPESLSQNWLILLKLKMETFHLKSAVISLRLSSAALLELDIQNRDLFDQTHKQLSPKQLLSRLQAKVGQQNIQQIYLHEDYRPEYAFSYQAVNSQMHSGQVDKRSKASSKASLKALRPSLLLSEPVSLSESIRIVHGPERIQSAWWTPQPICRDYFVAKNQQQQTLWVFRDAQQNWYVHGLFA